MIWGFMTPLHIATLVLAAAIIAGLYFALRGASRRVQTGVLLSLSLTGIAAIVYNLLRWDDPIHYLPLHLCSINAMLLPVAVLTRNKTLGNLLLVWCLGALAALILNYDVIDAPVFGEVFNFYYFPHVFEFGIPVLLFALKLIDKDPRCIGSTMGITMVIYTGVHLCNSLINSVWPEARVNYMFSIRPNNPLVELFYQVIPCEYWYMYLVLPIVFVYLTAVYAPEICRAYRNRHAGKRRV